MAIVKGHADLASALVHHLVGTAEIATMLGGLSRQRVHQLTSSPGFPEPVARLQAATIWERAAVEAWLRATGRDSKDKS